MNDDIDNEVCRLLRIDGVDGTESIKVMAICSQLLANGDYRRQVASTLDEIFNSPTFDFMAEFGLVIQSIIAMNKNVAFYKTISVSRMKYVLYAVFYHYAYKQQLEWLNQQNLGTIRLLYCNIYDLLMVRSESLQIAVAGCLSCLFPKQFTIAKK